MLDQEPLQLHDLLRRQRRDIRRAGVIDIGRAGKPRREISHRGRIDDSRIPAEEGLEVRVGEERRALPAHRQDQRGRQILSRQRAVRGLDAPCDPFRLRMLDAEVGLLPRQVGRHAHLLQPRLAALPAEADQEVGGGGERVRNAVDEVAAAVAVEVDRVLEIIGSGELHAAEFAGPVADHVLDALVAAFDDAQRVEQLLAEEIGPPAVIGERRERAENIVVAEIGAEVAFQAPEGGEHRRRHAVFLLDLREQRRVLLDLGEAVGNARAAHHPVGELQKGLVEHRLAVIAADDRLVECHAGRRSRNDAGRDALRGCVLLEVLEPALVAAVGLAAGCQSRRRQCRADHQYCRRQSRLPHRPVHLLRGSKPRPATIEGVGYDRKEAIFRVARGNAWKKDGQRPRDRHEYGDHDLLQDETNKKARRRLM